jgi:ketosteroid isomerase-like protein
MYTSILLLLVALVSARSLAQRADTAATKAALLAADSALAQAVQAKGVAPFLDALEPDAAVLFPGQPILRGAAEARTPFTARYANPSWYDWRPVHAIASADGRFGCTVGFSRFTSAADSAPAGHRGSYVTCWQLGTDGKWRVVGHQRNDGPERTSADGMDITLADAPHSAAAARWGEQLVAAQDADAAFAMMSAEAAGPGPAFAKYAASDAILIGGDPIPRGPEGIAKLFDGFPADRVLVWTPTRNFGAGSGGLAFTVGHSTNQPREGKTGPVLPGKYLTVWRQEPDGRWAYIVDLGSPRP